MAPLICMCVCIMQPFATAIIDVVMDRGLGRTERIKLSSAREGKPPSPLSCTR